jgi:omega-amidase
LPSQKRDKVKMNITLLQLDLVWEDKEANIAKIDAFLKSSVLSTDLILLPEMFTTGFSMQPAALAEPTEGLALTYMRQWAKRYDAAVCGSIIAVEDGKYYNRLLWVTPDGAYQTYDKRHLFHLAGEGEQYQAGHKKLIVTWRGWRICPLICYDVRFPVWSRNQENYDLLLYVANFPERRIRAWNTLLQARAIENQCYTVGVNRVGNDGNDIYHNGDSAVIDFEGNVLFHHRDTEIIKTIHLDFTSLQDFRQKLPFLKDKDSYVINTN